VCVLVFENTLPTPASKNARLIHLSFPVIIYSEIRTWAVPWGRVFLIDEVFVMHYWFVGSLPHSEFSWREEWR
jgi:hypothetical protein